MHGVVIAVTDVQYSIRRRHSFPCMVSLKLKPMKTFKQIGKKAAKDGDKILFPQHIFFFVFSLKK
jgi:hypothetical protein